MSDTTFHLPQQSVIIVHCPAYLEPTRMHSFLFVDGICVRNTANLMYDGKDIVCCRCAMSSIMRFEDGSEPKPNIGHSANGYPRFLEIIL